MDSQATPVGEGTLERDGHSPKITAQETVPGRTVFTEADNTDGWIATDLTVEVARLR